MNLYGPGLPSSILSVILSAETEWNRAYREINEFERQLMDDGTILIKFFLFITKDEQLARFRAREADPYKHWKISDEDWRNRRHWNENIEAAEDMIFKTSTERAPWQVMPSPELRLCPYSQDWPLSSTEDTGVPAT